MLRIEWVVAGVILVCVGIGLGMHAYQLNQPQPLDVAVGFVEAISGQRAPRELQQDKSSVVFFGAGGAVSLALGIGLILASRVQEKNQ